MQLVCCVASILVVGCLRVVLMQFFQGLGKRTAQAGIPLVSGISWAVAKAAIAAMSIILSCIFGGFGFVR
jgi:hypothetical protein